MMQILIVVLLTARPSPARALLPSPPESPASPAFGGLAALAVGGLSLVARLRRR